MDERTAEWFEYLSRALLLAALVVLVLAVVASLQIATSDSAIPFFQETVERESRAIAAIASLGAGVTAAGVLAGLGAILRVLLTLEAPRVAEYEALRSAGRPRGDGGRWEQGSRRADES
jgi:hypothetical protein